MTNLIITSFLWAFSFIFTGKLIAGKIDPYLVSLIRLLIASILLTPFLKISKLTLRDIGFICGIGAVQTGIMSLFLYNAFNYLTVPEVLLFSVTTPLFIDLMGDFYLKKFNPLCFLQAFLSISGAVCIAWHSLSENILFGFALIQMSNCCFAFGQVTYREFSVFLKAEKKIIGDRSLFALFFYGGFLITLPSYLLFGDFEKIPHTILNYALLFYLGSIATGLAYLLWNSGAEKVTNGTLAAFNNLVVPLGIFISFLFGSKIDNMITFLIGSSLILISVFFPSLIKRHLFSNHSSH